MKRINYFLLGILIALVVLPLLGCATIGKAADWTPEQKEVIAVMDAWQKAWDGGDAIGLGRLLTDEINMTSRTLGGNFTDKAKFLEAYRKWYGQNSSRPGILSQYVTDQEIKVEQDNASITRKIDWMRTGGRGNSSGTSIKTALLRKSGIEWKIYSEK